MNILNTLKFQDYKKTYRNILEFYVWISNMVIIQLYFTKLIEVSCGDIKGILMTCVKTIGRLLDTKGLVCADCFL